MKVDDSNAHRHTLRQVQRVIYTTHPGYDFKKIKNHRLYLHVIFKRRLHTVTLALWSQQER